MYVYFPMFLFQEYLLHLIEAADTANAREKSSGCCSIVKCPWWNIFKLAHPLHLRYYVISKGSVNVFDRVYTAVIRKDMHIFIGPESDHWECLSVTDSLTD